MFPYGMRNWTDSINAFGITGSAYSSNGYMTCGGRCRIVETLPVLIDFSGYPGAYGHEAQDLETWRSWGWHTLLKYDNCYIPYDNVTMENEYGRYVRMQDAVNDLAAKYNEEPFIYSLCQWGWEDPQVCYML